jgi:hypothetical protein
LLLEVGEVAVAMVVEVVLVAIEQHQALQLLLVLP